MCALAGMGFAEEIVSLFRKGDPDVIAVGAAALRWQFITFPLGSWIVMSNMMLQTIRKPVRIVLYSADFYSASLSGFAGCGNVSGYC